MSRKIIYLINPISGTQRKKSVRDLIMRKTRMAGIDFEILPSKADGSYDNLQEIIKRDGITDVVICGGDGTVNAVVNALQGVPVNFGIIPMGSGNGLAFAAKIPKDPALALEIVFKGKARSTDAFYINEKFSCMLCGIGFDAGVAHEFAKQKRRGLGRYIRISTIHFFRSRPFPFEINMKGNNLKTDAYFISIANSNQFGNQFTIAPEASLTDGLLDIVIVKKMNKLNLLFSVFSQVAGKNKPLAGLNEGRNKHILYLQTPEIIIRNPGLAPLHIDGEPAKTHHEFSIRVIPKCFKLLQAE